MTHFDDLVDVDPQTVLEIENMILGEDGANVPENLVKFKSYLDKVELREDYTAFDIARVVLAAMKVSIQNAMNYCTILTNNLEKELREGQAGHTGIKSLSPTQQYYFKQIEKPLPEDRAGVNSGAEIAKALRDVLGAAGVAAAPQNGKDAMEAEIEMQELKRQNELLKKENEELALEVAEKAEEEVEEETK
jgi:hypothetical protein